MRAHRVRGHRVGRRPGDAERGERYRPSYTRLREPGCYAFQVDGLTFSYPVVFRAELAN